MGLFKVNVTALKSAELALMGVGVALYRFFYVFIVKDILKAYVAAFFMLNRQLSSF
jgi:hypothetical protein